MRDINRIPVICRAIERLWKQNPDMRLGQLLEAFIFPKIIGTHEKNGVKETFATAYLWTQEDDESFKKIILNTDFAHPVIDKNKSE